MQKISAEFVYCGFGHIQVSGLALRSNLSLNFATKNRESLAKTDLPCKLKLILSDCKVHGLEEEGLVV